MDASTQLFIRACKSKNQIKRVERVYRKFYLFQNGAIDRVPIVSILLDICDEYQVLSLRNLAVALDPDEFGYYGISDTDTYTDRLFKILISKIRLSAVSKFEGFISPIRFRRDD
jgi:hypothetical protein